VAQANSAPSLSGMGNEYQLMGSDALWLGVKTGMAYARWQVKLCITCVIPDRFGGMSTVRCFTAAAAVSHTTSCNGNT